MFVVSGSGVWTPASAARSQVQRCAHRRRSAALAATPPISMSAVTPVPKASPLSAILAVGVVRVDQIFPSESLVTPTPWASPWSTKSLHPSTVTPFDNVTVSCFGCAARPHDGPTLRPRCPPTGAHMPRLLASRFSGGQRSRPFTTRFTPPKSAHSATLPGPHTGKSFDYVIAGVRDRAPRVCGLRTGGESCAAASDRRPGAYEGPLQRNHRGGPSRLPNRRFGRETTQQGGSTAAPRVRNRAARSNQYGAKVEKSRKF